MAILNAIRDCARYFSNRLNLLLAVIVFAFLPMTLHAELATNIAIDVKAMSMGNALTADPPGVMAIHYNPAGLALLEGRRADFQFLAVDFAMTADFSAAPGYEIFGYSDDPLICAQPEPATGKCALFKDAHSEVEGVALYIPVKDEFLKLPSGPVGGGPIPAFSIKPPGSRFTFANAIYAPMMAGLYKDDEDPGIYMGRTLALERITYLAPSVGYQVNDELSIGVSIGINYQALAMDMDFRAPNELLAFVRTIDESICSAFRGDTSQFFTDLVLFGICNTEAPLGPYQKLANIDMRMEERFSPTYNVGVLWKPNPRFSWGMSYKGETKMHLNGTFLISYDKPLTSTLNAVGRTIGGQLGFAILGIPTNIPTEESGLVNMDLVMPAHFQTGISYKVLPNLKFNFDVNFTDYGKWDAFNINFDRATAVTSLARLIAPGTTATRLSMELGFKSTWNWGMGLEWQFNDRMAFRFGYEPRGSAIPDDRRGPFVPINEAVLIGLGFGYKWDSDTEVDFTISKLTSEDSIPADTSCFANCTGLTNFVYNPYAGMDIETSADISLIGLAFRTSW